MLRGQIPQDRDPQEIVFDDLNKVDDMWTQLFYRMLSDNDNGELWYWGGTREKKFTNNFIERWVPNFNTYNTNFVPDVIFCRGGFLEYHTVLNKFPNAVSIYYGAGRRYLPQRGFSEYNIILQDSQQQVDECSYLYPKSTTVMYIKPAADNIFFPIKEEKDYDICFPANGSQKFKGHKFVYSTVPRHIKLLNLGSASTSYVCPNNVTSYRVQRQNMARNIAKCKVGIVVVNSNIDSCPRVIPELLACGLPIVVLEGTRFWHDMYIKSAFDSSTHNSTGELATVDNFWEVVAFVLKNIHLYSPRKYYKDYLSLNKSAEYLRGLL